MSGGVGSPTLQDAIAAALEQRLGRVYTKTPARVTRVASDGASVDLQPLVMRAHEGELGDDVVEVLPVVPSVPVMYYGGGGFVLTMPVAVGDTVLLAVADTSIDKWLATGGTVDPEDRTLHYIGTGAIAILGLRDFAHKLSSVPTDRAVLGFDGGLQSHFTRTEIKLGGAAATQPAAMKSDLQALYLAIAGLSGSPTPAISAPMLALKEALDAVGFPVGSATVKLKP